MGLRREQKRVRDHYNMLVMAPHSLVLTKRPQGPQAAKMQNSNTKKLFSYLTILEINDKGTWYKNTR